MRCVNTSFVRCRRLRHAHTLAMTPEHSRLPNRKTNTHRRTEMSNNKTPTARMHRVAAGAALAGALALIALGTATAGNAGTNSNSSDPTPVQTGPSYEPSGHTPYGTYQNDD